MGVESRGWAKSQDETQRAGLDEALGDKGDALFELQEGQNGGLVSAGRREQFEGQVLCNRFQVPPLGSLGEWR